VIVGHCVTSRGDLVADDGSVRSILTLGPISVTPDRQGTGIGGALIAETVAIATEGGWPLIVLVGHSDDYPRFGFERASPLGLVAPNDWLDIAWMALRLPSWTPDLRGHVRYPEAFGIA
jgi:putative acetyltransferase